MMSYMNKVKAERLLKYFMDELWLDEETALHHIGEIGEIIGRYLFLRDHCGEGDCDRERLTAQCTICGKPLCRAHVYFDEYIDVNIYPEDVKPYCAIHWHTHGKPEGYDER